MILKSEYKIATESNDHLYPVGAINDNYTNTDLINGNVEKFDFIHCSEVIEHIKEEDLNSLFNNVKNHLNDDGIFCCQISLTPDVRIINGIEIVLHHSIFTPEKWKDILQKNGFEFCTGKTDYNHFGYLFGDTKFRDHQNTSIYACLKITK